MLVVRRLIERLVRLGRHPAVDVIGTIAALALMGLLAYRALSDRSQLRLEWLPAASALILFAAAWAGMGLSWSILVTGGVDVRCVTRWMRSQLFRYIPGGVWAPIARFGDLRGCSADRMRLLSAEFTALVGGAGLFGGALAALTIDARWVGLVPPGLVLVGSACWLVRDLASGACILLWSVLCCGSILTFGVASGFAQHAVGGSVSFGSSMAAGLIAWAAGYVVLIAPSGLGAKEWAYVALLSPHPDSTLAAGALAARVLFMLGEALAFGASAAVLRVTTNGSDIHRGRPQTSPRSMPVDGG